MESMEDREIELMAKVHFEWRAKARSAQGQSPADRWDDQPAAIQDIERSAIRAALRTQGYAREVARLRGQISGRINSKTEEVTG